MIQETDGAVVEKLEYITITLLSMNGKLVNLRAKILQSFMIKVLS